MISVTIIVKNGEEYIDRVLRALQNFNEVIVYDTGSTDQTIAIAIQYVNVRVLSGPFSGFGKTHNQAAACALHDWILSIDADEILSPELANEILSLQLDPNRVYSLPFRNFFNGKQIKWCGWHPETHVRLYNKKSTNFSENLVHEGVNKKGMKECFLKHPVYHYPYGSISDFLMKMERYSTLFAEQHKTKKRSSPLIAILHGMAAFFRSYILKKGFLGGFEGFLISIYNGHTAFYKYLKLYHINKKSHASCPDVPPDR